MKHVRYNERLIDRHLFYIASQYTAATPVLFRKHFVPVNIQEFDKYADDIQRNAKQGDRIDSVVKCVMPPWPQIWFEYKLSDSGPNIGLACQHIPDWRLANPAEESKILIGPLADKALEEYGKQCFGDEFGYITFLVFLEDVIKTCKVLSWVAYPISKEGAIGSFGQYEISSPAMRKWQLQQPEWEDGEIRKTVATQTQGLVLPALLALDFLNCKNVSAEDEPAHTEANRQRHLKEGKSPLVRFKTLHVSNTSFRKTKRSTGSDTGESTMPLHTVRGHFAEYTETGKLFGRLTGRFWIPQHVRGDETIGIIKKTYVVHPREKK